jgi:peptidyl-prolyl cis-trans isomerase C
MLADAGASKSSDVARVYHERGLAWRGKGSLDRAIADFTRALELDPDFGLAHYQRGLSRRDQGSLDRAIADFTEALESGIPREKKPWAYFNRGLTWRDLGDLDRAVGDFTEVIYLKPRYAQAYSHRGLAWLGKQDLVRGCFDLQKACEFGSCEALELEQKKGACSDLADQLPTKEVRASHILLESEYEARKLLRRINQGEAFEDLAKEYSKCPSSERGGDLGFFERGQMVKEFDDVAFSTPKGIVTGPVRTDFGYHLIKVVDVR